MKLFQVRKLTTKWHNLGFHTKIIGVGAFLTVIIISATVLMNMYIHWLQTTNDESENPEGPYAHSGLKITDEEVYTNRTIRFTVHCYFRSYGGYPIPEVDLYQITKVFVCMEDDLLEFNDSLGDIQDVDNTSILLGDVRLSPFEEVRLEFQSRFPLQAEVQLYIGVLAMTCWNPPSINRWDRYTTVLVP